MSRSKSMSLLVYKLEENCCKIWDMILFSALSMLIPRPVTSTCWRLSLFCSAVQQTYSFPHPGKVSSSCSTKLALDNLFLLSFEDIRVLLVLTPLTGNCNIFVFVLSAMIILLLLSSLVYEGVVCLVCGGLSDRPRIIFESASSWGRWRWVMGLAITP